MPRANQTQIKLNQEEILLLIESLDLKGSKTVISNESVESYETWRRLYHRLLRALDRVDFD